MRLHILCLKRKEMRKNYSDKGYDAVFLFLRNNFMSLKINTFKNCI